MFLLILFYKIHVGDGELNGVSVPTISLAPGLADCASLEAPVLVRFGADDEVLAGNPAAHGIKLVLEHTAVPVAVGVDAVV